MIYHGQILICFVVSPGLLCFDDVRTRLSHSHPLFFLCVCSWFIFLVKEGRISGMRSLFANTISRVAFAFTHTSACVIPTQRVGTPSWPTSYGLLVASRGGRSQRARPGACSANFFLRRMAISKTAMRIKSEFSRTSRCGRPPGMKAGGSFDVDD